MPSARRPDSWLVLSGPPELRNSIDNTPTGSESLPGFVSEAQPAAIVAPVIVAPAIAAPVISAPTVAVSPAPVAARVWRDARMSARPHRSSRRARTLATAAAFIVIAVAATAVLITSIGGSARPSANVPPASQAAAPQPQPLVLAGPTVTPDSRWAVDAVKPEPQPPSSPVVAPTNRAVGTTGRRTAVPNQATKTSRAAAASYRGSLAIRSTPPGARVFVNGAHVGSTPLVLDNLTIGSRAVRVEADGFEGWSASTQIVANQQTRLSLTLARVRP